VNNCASEPFFPIKFTSLSASPQKDLHAARNKVPGITIDASLIMKRLAGRKSRKESIAFTHTNVWTEDAHARAELADDQFTDAQSVACIVAI